MPGMVRSTVAIVGLLAAWASGCSKEAECLPGGFLECTCAGGFDGRQLCSGDGVPSGTCMCTPSGPDASAGEDAGPRDAEVADGGPDASVATEPPHLEVTCFRAPACGEVAGMPVRCNSLMFAAPAPQVDRSCDLLVHLRNDARMPGGRPEDIVVTSLAMRVEDLDDPGVPVPEAVAGFSFHDERGQALVVSAASPLVIPGEGARVVRVRFRGDYPGNLIGASAQDEGLRMVSNDPDRPTVHVTVTAVGNNAVISALPSSVDFGPAMVGQSSTIAITNTGTLPLEVTDIRMAPSGSGQPFLISRIEPLPFTIAPGGRSLIVLTVRVAGTFTEAVEITSNAANARLLSVPVVSGPRPIIRTQPDDTVVFTGTSSSAVVVSNVGTADLHLLTLTILGPEDDITHPSVDDFSVDGCTTNPCTLAVPPLCPPGGGCPSMHTFVVRYANNDFTRVDVVTLRIESDDPVHPRLDIILSGTSSP